ncbi:hypothetical protein QR680_019333 [Steinernema hermaphroditum]|uniref:C-type lectin domain-containing protein n=1 Tax=Steinernema hermaphroditum TaxID=289476 RepID=A0AA39LAS2_9BILA|nr:hypothetical protein QR680_019333 [Steinernema hermaphroditum]
MKILFVLFLTAVLGGRQAPPGKWISSGNYVYLFNKNWLSWRDAEHFCVAQGGHLASIHSEDECAAVGRIKAAYTIGQHAWLGGFKLANSTQYLWNDGTAWNFTNWHDDSLSDVGRDCVATWYSGHEVWGKYDCAGAGIPSICKKKLDLKINKTEIIDVADLRA